MLHYWEDLSSPQIAGLSGPVVAVLPLGATEQHGPHLAVSVDTVLVEAVISRAAAHLDGGVTAVALPTLRVTKSGEHDRHPGTLSLSGETLLAVLRDIAASVKRAGIGRLCLLNGHGGNTALLEVAVREMRMTQNLIAVHASWFGFAETETLFDATALAEDLHGGAVETSGMLVAAPDRVDMSKARNFRPAMLGGQAASRWIGLSGQAARPGWIIDDLNPEGAVGNAAGATAEQGAALLASAPRNFAAFLGDFARFDHRATGEEGAAGK